MVRPEPWRSASAPSRGAASPQTMFWIANANEKTSRLHPRAIPIGCMNRPKVARTPMASSSTTTAQARIRCGECRDVGFMAPFYLPPPNRPESMAIPTRRPDTLLIHADRDDASDGALAPAIHPSVTHAAHDAAEFAEMATRPRHPRFYTRYGNPTHERVARLVARLEG